MEKEKKNEEKKHEEVHGKKHENKKEEKKDSCSSGAKCCCGVDKKFKPLIFLGLAFVLIVLGLIFFGPIKKEDKNILSLEEAKTKAEKFINDNFADPSFPLTIVSIEETENKGLYKLSVDIGGGEIIDSYISNDGKKFFPQSFDMEELEQELNGDNKEVSSEETPSSNVTLEEGFNESADFESDAKVVVYFFWGDGCPYCSTQKTAMSQWLEKYLETDIEIKTYEVWANPNNGETLDALAAAYDTPVGGVPMTFIGDEYWVGYAEDLGDEMISKIDECLKSNCENPGKRIQ